jgi:hypothetical protein
LNNNQLKGTKKKQLHQINNAHQRFVYQAKRDGDFDLLLDYAPRSATKQAMKKMV